MNTIIEKLFLKVFSENNLKRFEKFILFFATVGFIIHLCLILLNINGFLNLSISENNLLQNPISAIYTPFSFILVYEAFLLIYYLPRSNLFSLAKQYFKYGEARIKTEYRLNGNKSILLGLFIYLSLIHI